MLQQIISPNSVILDLGAFASGTTRAFIKKRCRCYVEDLPLFLSEIKIDDDFCFKEALRQHLVILNDHVEVDILLTWDLFHYLSIEEISILFELIADKLKPGTVIHATRHTSGIIPEQPLLFILKDDFSYQVIQSKSESNISNYSHATIELLQQFKEFNLKETLKHNQSEGKGLVEYTFVHQSESNGSVHFESSIAHGQTGIARSESNESYQSISLPNLTKQLAVFSKSKTHSIIDCGSSRIANIKVLESLANLGIEEDLFAAMTWEKSVAVGQPLHLGNQVFNYRDSVKFDLVLFWDLLCFISETETERLFEKLTSHMDNGALLHMVLPYTDTIGIQPCLFKIEKSCLVKFSSEFSGEVANQPLTTSQISKMFPGFRVQSYYFGTTESGEAYQEFLFQYRKL
ncbi:hypothetical protein FLL45_01950 [Aliikangiella marina]|uniref:Uncharacterized protein n=1 Tax=Aliikangiella marina TaxID=1712262 RepID=A0A545THN7_9GAMM|nr:hypothetical protein [Aliikangiella marina]TQV76744.1 hypothetical protein FLL45_01950 [Aliikangiella marina]